MANPGNYPRTTETNAANNMGGVASADFARLGAGDYIPTLYSGQLLVKFYETSVLGACTNTDYEGEIKSQGDAVIIRSVPDITIRDHVKGQTLVNEYPNVSSQTMNIDKGRYYAFVTDDIDEAQTDIKSFISNFTSEAAYHLRNEIEKEVLAGVVPDVGLSGVERGIDLGTVPDADGDSNPVNLDEESVVDKVLECAQLLDENNVPEDGRFLLLPPAFISLLKRSELKQANFTGDAVSPLRNGQVGMIDRFTIFSTNNLKADVAVTGDEPNENVVTNLEDEEGIEDNVNRVAQSDTTGAFRHCLFGHKAGISFASQMVKSESMMNQNGFGQLHRGLHVFGYKVVKPEAIGSLYARLG